MCQHIWTYRHVLFVDMWFYVASLSVPLIPIIWTLSACCHASAHMWTCQHVTSLPAPLKRIIWILSTCWHVLVHEDRQTSTDMWRRVLTCADICRRVQICNITLSTFGTNHLDHVGILALGPHPHTGICQRMWTCRRVLICAYMCQHVT